MSLSTLATSASGSAFGGAAMGLVVVTAFLLLIVGCLVGSLFLRIAARVVAKHKPSWKRALGAIAMMMVVSFFIQNLFSDGNPESTSGPEQLGSLLTYLAFSAIAGALLMHADGRRIGFLKGLLVMLLVLACYLGILAAIFVIAIFIGLSIPMLAGLLVGEVPSVLGI